MDPGNAQAQERLAAANHDLALVESGLENWPKVRDAADEAITIYRRLLEGGVLKPYLALGLPSCHFLLAQAHSRQGQRKEACSNIRESLRLYQIYEPHYAGRRDFLNEMSKVRRTMPTMCDADRTATPR